MTFANRLKNCRKRKKWTLAQLSAYSGLKSTNVGKFERGECEPMAETLYKLAKTLGVSMHELYTGEKK